jgi:hypothetical protein
MPKGFWMNPLHPRSMITAASPMLYPLASSTLMSGLTTRMPVEHFSATDIRHDHVQNHQIDLVVGIAENADGFLSAAGFENGVAHFLEHLDPHIQNIRLIVHQ